MPTETFLKLSDEKKRKIIEAGKQEFSKVPLEQASIKNIVEKAEIARGSFYQYFVNKEDLLKYILEENKEKIESKIDDIVKKSNGNIFELYIELYNNLTDQCFNSMNREIYKKIFENLKTKDEELYSEMIKQRKEKFTLIKNCIDTKNLNIKNEKELDLVIQILNSIAINSIVRSFKKLSKEEAKEEFATKIKMIEHGLEK